MPPLTPVVFHILLALSEGPRHGYGILKDVLDQTGGRVRLGPGTLYGSLQRLMDQGLVEEAATPAGADERRRYYRLHRSGRAALDAEVERLDALVRVAHARHVRPARSRA
jgi:DNA-binding PadR family transcriptional regulator